MSSGLEVRWQRALHRRDGAVAVGDDGSLVVTERHSRLIRLDPVSGDVVWDVGEVPAPTAVVALGTTEAVVHDSHGSIHCVELVDGRRRWVAQGSSRYADFATVHAGVVVVGGWRGYAPVQGRALLDGRVLWQHRQLVAGGLVPPRRVDRGILTGRRVEPVLVLLDPLSGERLERWRLPGLIACADLRPTPFTLSPDGSVVFGCQGGEVMRLDASGTLELLWRHPAPLGATPLTVVQDHVWVSEKSVGLAVVDLTAPRIVGRAPSAEPVVAVVPVGSRDVAVVASASGVVSMVQVDGVEVARVTLPRHLECAVAGAHDVVHVLGGGHLTALDTTWPEAG